MYLCEHVCVHTHRHTLSDTCTQTHAHCLTIDSNSQKGLQIEYINRTLLSDPVIRAQTLQVALIVILAREPLIYSVLQQTFVKCTLCSGKVRRLLFWISLVFAVL